MDKMGWGGDNTKPALWHYVILCSLSAMALGKRTWWFDGKDRPVLESPVKRKHLLRTRTLFDAKTGTKREFSKIPNLFWRRFFDENYKITTTAWQFSRNPWTVKSAAGYLQYVCVLLYKCIYLRGHRRTHRKQWLPFQHFEQQSSIQMEKVNASIKTNANKIRRNLYIHESFFLSFYQRFLEQHCLDLFFRTTFFFFLTNKTYRVFVGLAPSLLAFQDRIFDPRDVKASASMVLRKLHRAFATLAGEVF